MGRRIAQTAANLVDHVLPAVPLRQWVLTLPFPLGQAWPTMAVSLGAICRLFVDSVLGWYRRRMQREGVAAGQGGAVTVIQHCCSDLKLNPLLHTVFLYGVFTPTARRASIPWPASPTPRWPTTLPSFAAACSGPSPGGA